MRRLIGYITLALSMLIAIGVAATPILTKLSLGREYRDGREIVFKLQAKEGEELADDAADKVADEMRSRLDDFELEDYSVKVEGNDIVTASFYADQVEFNYIAKYLVFSGGKFNLSGEKDETFIEDKVLKTEDARIEYIEGSVPEIIIPTDGTKAVDLIKNLIKQVAPEEGESSSDTSKAMIKRDAMDGGEETTSEDDKKSVPDIFLWANFSSDDSDSYSIIDENPFVREKIIMSFNHANLWKQTDDEDEKETELSFICAQADTSGQLDVSGLKDFNQQAEYLLNMLKAPAYDVEILCPTRNVTKDGGVDYYENSSILPASVETLVSADSNVTIARSATFIATLVAIVIVSLLLVVYYRINALAMVATTLGTLFITLISFRSMAVLFNTPAIIGLLILAGGVLFSEIIYANRFKEEVYKGRSIKKANQEASKRSNLVTLDASVILAFTGLMMYALGGTALKPLGVVLFFGAVFGLLMNLLVFKLLMYLVTNSSNLQCKFSVFNIDEKKVPNLLSAEAKPAYVSPYENVDFTKRRKVSGIVLGALLVAAVAVISVFGAINKSPLNVANAYKDTTVIYTQLKVDNPIAEDETNFISNVLEHNTDYVIKSDSVEMKKVSTIEYDGEKGQNVDSLFFIVKIDKTSSEDELTTISETISNTLEETISSEDYSLDVRSVKELVYIPDQGAVILATSISIVGVALYCAFRFRPSRGLALAITAEGASLIGYGLLVATRIGTTAISSLAMPIIAVSMMLASLFYLTTEKAMRKETHEELTREAKKSIMVKALGKSAAPLLVFMLITIYIAINFFGFGVQQTAYLFASALIGEIVALVALLTVFGPLSHAFDKILSKIHLPKIKLFEKKEKSNTPAKRNSSEPEETIFIGIND